MSNSIDIHAKGDIFISNSIISNALLSTHALPYAMETAFRQFWHDQHMPTHLIVSAITSSCAAILFSTDTAHHIHSRAIEAKSTDPSEATGRLGMPPIPTLMSVINQYQ